MSKFAIMKSKVFYGSWVVTGYMRVSVFLILLTLLAPISQAQPSVQSNQFDCSPNELSFGVNNAFVRAMTDESSDVSDQWLVYMPSMCGKNQDFLYFIKISVEKNH